jgi:hypothetical protein
MASTTTIQFQVSPEFRKQLEESPAKLNLSLAGYICYLHERVLAGPRLDRHVQEVFGRHGELMRRLAK